jgi:hypothetical protein
MITHLVGMTYYVIVQKKLLSDKKAGFDIKLPKGCLMRVSKIIPIGTKNYNLANGYAKYIKSIPVDFEKETLLIVEFEYRNLERERDNPLV